MDPSATIDADGANANRDVIIFLEAVITPGVTVMLRVNMLHSDWWTQTGISYPSSSRRMQKITPKYRGLRVVQK